MPTIFVEALQLAADKSEETERCKATVDLMKPKVEAHDRLDLCGAIMSYLPAHY
jgi:phage antirepressor YoqD-like protein